MNLLTSTLSQIEPQDAHFRAAAHSRLEQLAMPYWALGRLMDLAEDLAGMTRSMRPPVSRRTIVTMAGDHGVVAEGVSKYPQEVTAQMVGNFVNGGAGINVLARQAGAQVVVVDMGVAGDLSALVQSGKIKSRRVGPGTRNMAIGPAMSREEAVQSIEAGIAVAKELGSRTDVFATGDMGIGNTTPSSAIIAAITGCDVAAVTGRGTGIDDSRLQHKISVIEKALKVNHPDPADAIDLLAKIGGFEIGGIAGLILGAASMKMPVLVDGIISTAGALIANCLEPRSMEYAIAAHQSVEQGHRIALQHLWKEPLLDLNLRLGEGTGAALAMHLVDAAVRVLTEVASFDEASVSREDK
jgi:nicotinate-nucleotide--dimethylbenzimidazole phosphoribosyltransferase